MDGSAGATLVLALLAALAAGASLVAWRGERTRRARAEGEARRLDEALGTARAEAEAAARAGRGRQDEVGELRRKLEKARKRAFSAQEERAPLEARVKELEGQARAREEEAARLRGRLDGFDADREAAGREAARLREELARAEKAAAAVRVDPGEHAFLRKRADAAEDEVRRLGAALREAEHEASRWRQRERVQRRAYTVLRGELEIARDHLRVARGEGALELDDGAARSHDAPDSAADER